MAKVSIDVDRCDRIYLQNDKVKGKIVLDLEKPLNHGGVVVSAYGTVKLSVRDVLDRAVSLHISLSLGNDSTHITKTTVSNTFSLCLGNDTHISQKQQQIFHSTVESE